MKRVIFLGFGAGVFAVPSVSRAETYEVGAGEDVEAAIAMLQPGDELVLGGGMYVLTERFSIDLVGSEDQPITIRAKEGELPHIHRPDANENLVDIDNAQWVVLDGIEWSGGSAGIRIASASNFTISNCEIHSTNDVALRANEVGATYENLHIVGNEIHDTDNTGEGMYLGCNADGCRLANSVIERNWVHHTNAPTVEQGDGIEIKEGSYGNVVRDNVIHDTNYPCILTYSAVGNGEANIIEGNAMWNCGDHAIQSAADAVIRNNIILSANAYGISMQPHQSGAPANLTVVHNTIVVPGSRAINVSGVAGAVTIANNAVYSQAGPAIFLDGDTSQVVVVGNVGVGGLMGAAGGYVDGNLPEDFVDANFGGAPPNDVFPTAAALAAAGDPTYAVQTDFNGLSVNDPPDAGAYAYDPEGNPGWVLQAGFKEFPDSDGSDTEGGTSGDDGGATVGTSGDGQSDESGGGGGGESGGGSGAQGGETGTGGNASAGLGLDQQGDEDGCSCRAEGRSGSAGGLGLLMLGFFWGRRRSFAR